MASLEAFRAVMVGVAVGDAYGRPLEVEGAAPASDWLEPGSTELRGIEISGRYAYSDDTETTIILAESIASACGFNPYVFARMLAEKADVENPVRGYGVAVAATVEGLRRGIPWWVTAPSLYGGSGSMGNGAAVRVPPVPLFYDSLESVERIAVAQSYITHTNPVALEGARLMAKAIRLALEGYEPVRIVRVLADDALIQEYRARISLLPSLLSAKPAEIARRIGNSAIAYESVPAAIYAFLAGEGEPLAALYRALSLGGDADSIAAMAVALACAYTGRLTSELERLGRMVEGYEYLNLVAERLYEAKNTCEARLRAS